MIVELDSTSFPLCSAYTLRKPVSLPVQLESGRIQELKGLAEICPISLIGTCPRCCLGFPDSAVSKESACSARDPGGFLGWEDPLEKG